MKKELIDGLIEYLKIKVSDDEALMDEVTLDKE